MVSHYRIVRRLGTGGMGAVFLAQDMTLDRPVAIKWLSAADDVHARRRLLREAQAVAALDHKGIAAVYEVGHDPAGGDFIVMQYVEGETLAARLQRGPLLPAEALTLGSRIADALAAAHRRGVIHRDLKPHNIVISAAGGPKLLDFGLARRTVPSASAGEQPTMSATVTRPVVAGTPGYMSPEQVRGEAEDARSDVFALGCVLYECLTGRRAFVGASVADVCAATLQVEPPPPSTIVSDLGPAHDALCARLLAKVPAERCQSAEEALGAIRTLADTARFSGAGHTASRTLPGMPVLAGVGRGWMAVIVAALVLLAAAAWAWSRRPLALPDAPAAARQHHDLGVAALRDGTYGGARDQFREALRLHADYVQAHAGVAQACKELEDEPCATQAVLRINQLVPNRTRLPIDDRLQLEGVLALVARTPDGAVTAYRQLADRHATEAVRHLDLGVALMAAEDRAGAREAFTRAVTLDAQLPAAHVRLGVLDVQEGHTARAFASLDEAVRLYRLADNAEGESEAVLRKATALNNTGDFVQAGAMLGEVRRLAGTRYVSQRVRARFEEARAAVLQGRPEDVEAVTEEAVREAVDAGLYATAAGGRIDLANVFLVQRQQPRAEAELTRAIDLAARYGARRTEMRASLQLASLKLRDDPAAARELATAPLAYFTEGRYLRLEADAKNILSRALEQLGDFDEARRLAREVLAYADATGNLPAAADALENLAGQAELQGHLPEALAAHARLETIYRQQRRVPVLSGVLLRKAETLILLGRGDEAALALDEVEAALREGTDTDPRRPRRVARLRALRAVVEGRYDGVEAFAAAADVPPGGEPDTIAVSARVLRELARAHTGRPGVAPSVLEGWLGAVTSAVQRREPTLWAAQVLAHRRQPEGAGRLVDAVWASLGTLDHPDLRWRLAALAPAGSVTIPARTVDAELQKLRARWPAADVDSYLRRADLKILLASKGADR